MKSAFVSFLSVTCLMLAIPGSANAADLGLVPASAGSSCQNLALVCENGRSYPICPIAISVAGELVTGRLMTSHGGTHIRLIPMGNGYRYAGRGVWFDGKYAAASLYFGPNSPPVGCEVTGSASAPISVSY
jgi:hypothetical protein